MDKTRTIVTIAGQEYTLAGVESEEHIKRTAKYVDAKLNGLKCTTFELNPQMLLTLCAVNIADELIKLKEEFNITADEMQLLKDEIKKLKAENSSLREERKSPAVFGLYK